MFWSLVQRMEVLLFGTCIFKMIKYFGEVVIKLGDRYSEKKIDKGILDFNDFEHYALKILENDEVQNEYNKKFDHIFVDEYQDSNIVQETILNRIKREKQKTQSEESYNNEDYGYPYYRRRNPNIIRRPVTRPSGPAR